MKITVFQCILLSTLMYQIVPTQLDNYTWK